MLIHAVVSCGHCGLACPVRGRRVCNGEDYGEVVMVFPSGTAGIADAAGVVGVRCDSGRFTLAGASEWEAA